MRVIYEGYDPDGLYTVQLTSGHILYYQSQDHYLEEYRKAEELADAYGRLELTSLFPRTDKSIN